MMMRNSVFLLIAVLGSTGAIAQPAQQAATAPTSPKTATKTLDPNEMVCEREQEPGSRLAAAKVCHTRAEWAELRSQDRQDIDRVQTQRGAMAPH
jgi:hypothetical protein